MKENRGILSELEKAKLKYLIPVNIASSPTQHQNSETELSVFMEEESHEEGNSMYTNILEESHNEDRRNDLRSKEEKKGPHRMKNNSQRNREYELNKENMMYRPI